MKKVIILILLIVISIFPFLNNKTYSKYKKNINVNINTDSANLICDAEIDNPGTYISTDGWAYFKIIVKNYNTNNIITQVPIQYNLNITNQDGSSAFYRYLDANGNTGDFLSSITTRNYSFTPGSKQSQVINIEVKTNSMISEDVDFKVDLNCYQVEK